jgi:hypothetical protein
VGYPVVAIEADASLADATAAPTLPSSTTPGRRTFYRRYVTVADPPGCLNAFLAPQAAYACGGGDQREPLGLKYAVRWFDTPFVTSNLNVWRSSAGSSSINGGLADLLGFAVGKCNTSEPQVVLFFYDEDENVVIDGTCPSPCLIPQSNFPLESQRRSIRSVSHPNWPAGWAVIQFFKGEGPVGSVLDQAYMS